MRAVVCGVVPTQEEQPSPAVLELEEGALRVRLRVTRVEAKVGMQRHHLAC